MDGAEINRRLSELLVHVAKRIRPSADALAPLGLTPAQARALAMIEHCPEPLRMTALAERLHVVPRAVTPLVDALEEAGLVRRRTDPENRRSTLLELTERGQVVAGRVRQVRQATVDELLSPLSVAQRRALLHLLETVDETAPLPVR